MRMVSNESAQLNSSQLQKLSALVNSCSVGEFQSDSADRSARYRTDVILRYLDPLIMVIINFDTRLLINAVYLETLTTVQLYTGDGQPNTLVFICNCFRINCGFNRCGHNK